MKSTKTVEESTKYLVVYGPKSMKDRNKKEFVDLTAAQNFFTEQQKTKHVDVFEVNTRVETTVTPVTPVTVVLKKLKSKSP